MRMRSSANEGDPAPDGASIELTPMVKAAGADTVDEVVDHFIHRFLRVTLAQKDRAVLVDFLRGKVGDRRRTAE